MRYFAEYFLAIHIIRPKNILESIFADKKHQKSSFFTEILRRPIESLKENGIRTNAFIFIDVLSSHYGTPKPVKNCVFLDSPQNLDAIQKAIKQIMKRKKLHALIFDTISAMLIYQGIFPILRFTHGILSETNQSSVKKIYFVLKNDPLTNKENAEMISDLKMFADKLIEPPLKQRYKNIKNQ